MIEEQNELVRVLRACHDTDKPVPITVSGRRKIITDADEYNELAALKRILLGKTPKP